MRYIPLLFLWMAFALIACRPRLDETDILATSDLLARGWVTNADSSELLEVRGPIQLTAADSLPDVLIDPSVRYQELQGFGYTLTGGSAQLIHQLPDDRRAKLLHESLPAATALQVLATCD
ncbi:hypothetical protein [Lewinella sp. IMCC34191]|uniref:hypothetical protein n=1 Tax=Lewinella sp. IMCC34191 TaxID=2259172 RepID=UPI0018E599C0|nr:hypothetical protein [Lewinella sp. IMCC34191]